MGRARVLSRRPVRQFSAYRVASHFGIIDNTDVVARRVVLDTNILVAALRSRKGAAFRVLSLVGKGRFEICLSVPLVLEYEDALLRHIKEIPLTETDVGDLLDYLCTIANQQEIFFLWRPYLRDPKDDLLLEVAVAGNCEAIITYNRRDFAGTEKFGLRILTPGEFLKRIGGLR